MLKKRNSTGKLPDRAVHVMSSQIVSSPHTEVCPRIATCTTRDPQVASDVKDREVSNNYNPGKALGGDQPRVKGLNAKAKCLFPVQNGGDTGKAAHCNMYSARFSSALVSRGGG